MDSLTQITLGAAVGEIVLGKKVGNRALLWGAVGGTIPDLDIITGAFLTPLQELAAHRGISHSIVFAIIGGFLSGWMIHRLYQSRYHRYLGFLGWFLLPTGVVYFISRIFDNANFNIWSTLILGSIVVVVAYVLFKRYFIRDVQLPTATKKEWQWLMFWALITHPLLDCFTTYGTQLFMPFSNYRVAFNTVAVADFFYTIPFLICVIVLSYMTRTKLLRRKLAWTGIIISSAYLVFCIWNKSSVNHVWTSTLEKDKINYSRFMTSPSILTNFLWTCIAETEEGYVSGQYSIFDKNPIVQYEFIPRNRTDLSIDQSDPTIDCLKWFSNGYYSITEHSEGIQFNDLRFGSIPNNNGSRHYIFNFVLENDNGVLKMIGSNGGPPPGGEGEMLQTLYNRIKGI